MADDLDLEHLTATFFRVGEARDWDTWTAMFAPTAVVQQNGGPETGVPGTVANLQRMFAAGVTFGYERQRRIVGDRAVVEQHDVRMRREGHGEVVLDVCVVLRFDDDGLITRLDEYFDSAAAAPLFART
jgi:ketosteroid isomerase-like protein